MSIKEHSPGPKTEILIVEDSRTQAEQLRYLLEQHHFKITVATNGKQALSLLSEYKPALVISDIIMPEMNGYELCKSIKTDFGDEGIPVILLTSLEDVEDVLEGLACGADSFITKPYSEDYILAVINQILANLDIYKGERKRIDVEIVFAGKNRFISAEQQQILTLLLSLYEAAVHKNKELTQTQEKLRLLNENLEGLVEQRTAMLTKEIKERKRAQDALLLKNFVFDASIAANSIADLNGVITEANEAFLRVWGYPSKDEVVGKPLAHFINDPNEGVAIVTALNSTGQWEGDYIAKRKDGSTFNAHG
ncbi:MAG: response regulator, partial [Candidatus Aminicenantes bacterium]|nr:response regulator [Candidatus Aminicenantes bacterium]